MEQNTLMLDEDEDEQQEPVFLKGDNSLTNNNNVEKQVENSLNDIRNSEKSNKEQYELNQDSRPLVY
jgi:hypothetical protein